MKSHRRFYLALLFTVSSIVFSLATASAQDSFVILADKELMRVVPTSFYFEGLSAPTQMRNTAAARFGAKRFVIAGLVDTSGYSVEVRAKYEGFFITDSTIMVGDKELGAGAYGFGFSDDGKFNIFDVGGNQLISTGAPKDTQIRRPRPLMMMKGADGLRLYGGRNYVVIAAR